jgi:hypothetical protein
MNRITQLRQHQDPHEHAKLGDIINCLQVLEKDISSVIQRNQAPDAYLTFISAFYPDEKKTISSIILP